METNCILLHNSNKAEAGRAALQASFVEFLQVGCVTIRKNVSAGNICDV